MTCFEKIRLGALLLCGQVAISSFACSSSESDNGSDQPLTGAGGSVFGSAGQNTTDSAGATSVLGNGGASAGGATASNGGSRPFDPTGGASGGTPNTIPPSAGGAGVITPPPPPIGMGGFPNNIPPPAAGGAPGAGGVGEPPPPAGPEDGDPSQPVVSVPGIPCGPNPSLFGLTATNTTIGGRDVHVSYPCNKHKGAPVSFVLNLHGTMPTEELKLYQVAYFSINAHVTTHNIITVAPKSVVSQWGNGDGGVDEPHLMAVIDWVYTTFADLDIRAMWVAGHSWGAMYTSTFGCKQELASKVKGLILESGFPALPQCASRVSVISSIAENDIAGPMNQGALPGQHGCGAAEQRKLGNNNQTLYPNCQPGFVHSDYFMLGKMHADYMDAVVVEDIANLIKIARQ